MYTRGFPRNLGDAVVFVLESGGHPLNKPRPAAVALVAEGAKKSASTVLPREGNEMKRGGQQQVGSSHCN
ncbi:MAG: hypothetical protein JXA30_02765 [Deltaproteobacteria bacterium]|nr:hypothetical protein [Deltaproteobacteria bacterium]